MIKETILTEKTARYFVLGTPSDKIKRVWIVCHGYAQLANYFLKKFEVLDNGENLVVAPEGLHRFYWNGFSGRVVASWMTKEDRLDDIEDYVRFLDTVAQKVLKEFPEKNPPELVVLGFSQGAATVCRWLCMGKTRATRLVIWAGAFPEDIDYFSNRTLFASLKPIWVSGTEDEFLTEEKVQSLLKNMKEKGIPFDRIVFDGKHTIEEKALKELEILLSA